MRDFRNLENKFKFAPGYSSGGGGGEGWGSGGSSPYP